MTSAEMKTLISATGGIKWISKLNNKHMGIRASKAEREADDRTPQEKLVDIRSTIICDIKSYNKHMPDEYIEDRTTEELLALAHPSYRGDYEKELRDIKKDIENLTE